MNKNNSLDNDKNLGQEGDELPFYDICVIGGGINGTAIARDAAGQGLKVVLLEKGDLGSATSSASSKFLHGGLRYLEHYAFGFVRKALKEREILLSIAPHIARPMRFILPHNERMRSFFLIRFGVKLYDFLAGRKTRFPKSGVVDLAKHDYGAAMNDDFTRAITYSDCAVDDARLVVLNALSAKEKGADIITYDGCDYISEEARYRSWRVRLSSGRQLRARMIVNAGGPWVKNILGENGLARRVGVPNIRLVRGSHIVLSRLYEGDHAYILQNHDGRIVFAFPYHGLTAVGTTDVSSGTDPDLTVEMSNEERDYLLSVINAHFKGAYTADDIVNHWSGVRTLIEDAGEKAQKLSRDHKLHLQIIHDLPVLSVFGGKLTTYRTLAEEAMEYIGKSLDMRPKSWSGTEPLPGGDFDGVIDEFTAQQWARYPWMPQGLVIRLARSYGTRMDKIIATAGSMKDLGRDLGQGFTVAELEYLINNEWARTTEDILWRRTKLGLLGDQDLQRNVEEALREKGGE